MNINFTEEKKIIIELIDVIVIKIIYCEYSKKFTILYIKSDLNSDWITDNIYDTESLVYLRLQHMFSSLNEEIKNFNSCLKKLIKFEVDDGLSYLQQ